MSRVTPGALGNLTASITPSGTQDVNLVQVGGVSFSLGQQLAASSLPVVLTASQLSTLTPLSTVAVTQSGTWDEVGINDSGNSITVDGTITANAGTNLNTSLLALESGGNLAILAGIVSSARAAVNPISGQIGVQGASGTVSALTQRVVLATDVALPAGTNVIGHVIVDSGASSVTQGTSPWIVAGGGTAGTAATGVVTIQGIASMTAVQVSQATGTNLHMVVDSGTVTTVTTVSAARIVGNAGAVLDGVNTAATAPANGILGLGIYNSTEPSPSTGQSVGIQLDSKGRARNVIMDAAGNTRGANVDSSNRLSVTVDNIAAAQTIATVTTVTNVGAGNVAATIAADGVTPTVPGMAAYGFVKTPGANTWDRSYSVVNATNSIGTGIPSAGILAQFDDSSPTSITENQFGNLRMSANRNFYTTIRDAAGNERGLNISSGGNITVDAVTSVNAIKPTFTAATAFTITIASLATSTAGVGRQSTLITNTSTLYRGAKIHVKVTTGTSPTANTPIYIYLIQSDATIRDDAAGTTDAGLTVVNATLLGTLLNNSASSNVAFNAVFDTGNVVSQLGAEFGVAIVHSTGVNLNATGGNHAITYIGYN